jgi:hypothetical protein
MTTERGLELHIDSATQYATATRDGHPVATFQRRRTYETGPAWKCFDLHGALLFSHRVTDAPAMLRRLSRRLEVTAERNEAIRAECERPMPYGC